MSTTTNKGDENRKKWKTRLEFLSSNFEDHYVLNGHILGTGTFSRVESCHKKIGYPTVPKCYNSRL